MQNLLTAEAGLSIYAGDWSNCWLFEHFCQLEIGGDKKKKLSVVITKML